MLEDEREGVDPDDLPTGKSLADRRERSAIVPVPIGGDKHAPLMTRKLA